MDVFSYELGKKASGGSTTSGVPVYVFDVLYGDSDEQYIDITLKQLRDIIEATNYHFLIFINWGEGMYEFMDNVNANEYGGTIANNTTGTTFNATNDDDKFITPE